MSSVQTPQKPSSETTSTGNFLLDTTGRAVMFYQNNPTAVYGMIAGLVLLAFAIAGYVVYMEQASTEANRQLGRILPVYERGNYEAALEGVEPLDGTSPRVNQPGQQEARAGLLSIIENHGRTGAGNLARFYAGNAYFELGQYDKALEMYQAFEKEENFIGASAYAAKAAIYESRAEFDKAGDAYVNAAEQHQSELRTPEYLLDAAQAYEEAGNASRAEELYNRILADFDESSAAPQAEIFLARLQAQRFALG